MLLPRRASNSNLTDLKIRENTGGSAMQRRIRELKNNQSGFTLIELLIVIVILGVLAAIVVFAVSAFNKNGQAAACKADFKNVEIADEAYFAKNQAYPPVPAANPAATPPQPAGYVGNSALVPTYLKEGPAINPNYSIVLTTTGLSLTVGTTTSTDSSACSGLT
jgi:prepilin-type N-terminal cleavage/methylation domain-containing protein